MGFLEDSLRESSVYFEVTTEKKLLRPLAKKPVCAWCHKIQSIPDNAPKGVKRDRNFAKIVCTSNGRGGQGCYLCNNPDPLWGKLSVKGQTNKAGNRVDFPKTPSFLLPVWDYSENCVRILDGGNQVYDVMNKWYDAQTEANKDLRKCDYLVWKSGTGLMTKYESSRNDESKFEITPEMLESAKQGLNQANLDLTPPPLEVLVKMINGTLDSGFTPDLSANQLAAPQATLQLPSAVPPAVADLVADPVPPTPGKVTTTVVETEKEKGKKAVDLFAQWLSEQKELSGPGLVEILIPTLTETIGSIEYHKASPTQLSAARMALEQKLAAVRK